MILRLRLPNKFLLCLLSLTAGAVAGAFWTVHGSAGTASNGRAGRAFGVIGATNGNHNRAKSTYRPRKRARKKRARRQLRFADAHASGWKLYIGLQP